MASIHFCKSFASDLFFVDWPDMPFQTISFAAIITTEIFIVHKIAYLLAQNQTKHIYMTLYFIFNFEHHMFNVYKLTIIIISKRNTGILRKLQCSLSPIYWIDHTDADYSIT